MNRALTASLLCLACATSFAEDTPPSKFAINVAPPTLDSKMSQQGQQQPKVAVQSKRKKQWWGLEVGAYFPVDAEVRQELGDALPRIGLSPITRRYDQKFAIGPELTFLYAKNTGDRHLLLIPLSLVVSFGLGDSQALKSYFAAGAGPAYYDYRLVRFDDGKGAEIFSDKAFGWNANFELGVLVNDRLSLQGRYDLYQQRDGFDFSGFSVNLNFAIFRW